MLQEAGHGQRWDCAYTDSATDLPILRRSVRRVVVNPRPADRARIQRALEGECEFVEWQ